MQTIKRGHAAWTASSPTTSLSSARWPRPSIVRLLQAVSGVRSTTLLQLRSSRCSRSIHADRGCRSSTQVQEDRPRQRRERRAESETMSMLDMHLRRFSSNRP